MELTSYESSLGLTARLSIPRLRADRVRRPRLIDCLEKAAGARLIFIQAPAGFGKTTLMADWLATSRRPFAWLGIEGGAEDADAFLARLDAAIDIALSTVPFNRAYPVADLTREAFLFSIATRIADSRLPLILVIDDFHNLRDTASQALISRLCDILPTGTCLLIASREGIPFPAARLRARGELKELGMDDLRFTAPESREFLSRADLPRLTDEAAATLEARTEGWVAGLQLAVIAFRDSQDPSRFIDAFGGTSRDVYDFLTEEALAVLSQPDLDFLTASSVVDRFCAPLCAAITGEGPAGIGDATARLQRLERNCLFIVPLDDKRSWYRFHHLFRETLLGRLRAFDPDRERELRLAASTWLGDHGYQADALRQAVLAGDAVRAGLLAENQALSVLEKGDLRELREGFESFDASANEAGPWFRLASAWAAAYAGELEKALARAAAAEEASPATAALLRAARGTQGEHFRSSSRQVEYNAADVKMIRELAARSAAAAGLSERRLAGQIESLRAYVARLQMEARVGLDRAVRALELLPSEDLVPRCHAEYSMASSLYVLAIDVESDATYLAAMETARRAGVLHVRYLAAAGLANLRLALGKLDSAKSLCLAISVEPEAHRYPALGEVFIILSQLEWEREETSAALEAGRRGLELSLRWGQADSLVFAYVTLALALSAAGDSESGLELLTRASRLESVSAWHKLNIEEAVASIELERGNRAGADDFCSRPQTFNTYEGFFTLAHWLILRKRAAEALPYIEYYRERGEKRGTLPRLADAYILMAMVAKNRGERVEARDWLEKALAIAIPRGLIRRFIHRGEGIRELLAERQADKPDPFVERLLGAFAVDAERRKEKARARRIDGKTRSESAVESLSPRELEVLRLLGEGLTAEEIAERSFVAPSTIRSHVKAIYGKLGVHRRVEALRRAGELGLI